MSRTVKLITIEAFCVNMSHT